MKLWGSKAEWQAAREAKRQTAAEEKRQAVAKADAAFEPVALHWLDIGVERAEPDALAAAERWRSTGAFDPQDFRRFSVWGRRYLISVGEEGLARMRTEDLSSEETDAIRDDMVKLAKQFDSMRNWMEYHAAKPETSSQRE